MKIPKNLQFFVQVDLVQISMIQLWQIQNMICQVLELTEGQIDFKAQYWKHESPILCTSEFGSNVNDIITE